MLSTPPTPKPEHRTPVRHIGGQLRSASLLQNVPGLVKWSHVYFAVNDKNDGKREWWIKTQQAKEKSQHTVTDSP